MSTATQKCSALHVTRVSRRSTAALPPAPPKTQRATPLASYLPQGRPGRAEILDCSIEKRPHAPSHEPKPAISITRIGSGRNTHVAAAIARMRAAERLSEETEPTSQYADPARVQAALAKTGRPSWRPGRVLALHGRTGAGGWGNDSRSLRWSERAAAERDAAVGTQAARLAAFETPRAAADDDDIDDIAA